MSSSDLAISIHGLSKAYTIVHGAAKQPTFRDIVTEKLRHPFQRNHRETFWALKDVSFDVKRGEVLGIIGRNGAGKSTLLKVLSRITEPTAGKVEVFGRVGSLLEVGTGFHPELTGRENIYLNGSILGMTREEIRKQFDAIIDFADVERFLDTPVKRYSSGMYVRLAFAVAAHLEPEVLVVDEVLAVGDTEFQRKCLGKMEDVSRKEGRAVLFVSHNMAVIQSLCPRSLLLDGGGIRFYGATCDAIDQYLLTTGPATSFSRPAKTNGTPTITCGSLMIKSDTLAIDLEIISSQCCTSTLEIKLHGTLGIPIGFASVGLLDMDKQLNLEEGSNKFGCRLDLSRIAVGKYFVSIQLGIPWINVLDRADAIMQFELNRAASRGMQHALRQEWGLGFFEIPLSVQPYGKQLASQPFSSVGARQTYDG